MADDIFEDVVVEPAKIAGDVAESVLDAVGAPVPARVARAAIVAPAAVAAHVMRRAAGWFFGDE